MRKLFKWLGVVLGSLVGLVLLLLSGFYISASIRLNKSYAVPVETITIPADAASIERGERWVASGACIHCHGSDLAGTALLDDPAVGKVPAVNLTPGRGGAGEEFTDEDWVRAIRYGVDSEGRGLLIMPSAHFYYYSDRDLGDIIAYLKSIPPVDREWPEPELLLLGKILVGAGAFSNMIEAETIDLDAGRPSTPAEGVTAEYGGYLARVSGCRVCHSEDLAGEENPPDPAAPPVPSLAAGSEVSSWSEAQFISTMRTGITPDNRPLTGFMPWKEFRHMTDDQLKAIWLYLKSVSGE